MPINEVQLNWPTELAISPLDGSLHIVDDGVILKVGLTFSYSESLSYIHEYLKKNDVLNPPNSAYRLQLMGEFKL